MPRSRDTANKGEVQPAELVSPISAFFLEVQMQREFRRRNPVAKALALPALKNRIVPKRRDERRAKEKLRQSLRNYRTLSALFSQPRAIETG